MTIRKFLEKKQDKAWFNNRTFEDFPIEFQNEEGELEQGWLQDAVEEISGNNYSLEVVVLRKNGKAFLFEKTCKAPVDCEIDWDSVHCAYNIKL